MLETFTLQTFAPYLKDTFQVLPEALPAVEMQLIAVNELGTGSTSVPVSTRRGPFSLVFRGPRAGYLPQHIYPMQHAELGAFELFLVPIGPDHEGMLYEAIFT